MASKASKHNLASISDTISFLSEKKTLGGLYSWALNCVINLCELISLWQHNPVVPVMLHKLCKAFRNKTWTVLLFTKKQTPSLTPGHQVRLGSHVDQRGPFGRARGARAVLEALNFKPFSPPLWHASEHKTRPLLQNRRLFAFASRVCGVARFCILTETGLSLSLATAFLVR